MHLRSPPAKFVAQGNIQEDVALVVHDNFGGDCDRSHGRSSVQQRINGGNNQQHVD